MNAMGTSLLQVALGCKELDVSVEFYRDKLGADCIARFDPPRLAFFRLGGTRLLLEESPSPTAGSSVLYLSVSDIQLETLALQGRGVAFESGPHLIHTDTDGTFGEAGTEEWMAFFLDPDGNHLAIVERRPGASSA